MIFLGTGLFLAALAALRQVRRRTRLLVRGMFAFVASILLILAVPLTISGGFQFWVAHRPQPANVQEALFRGVTYIRDVRQQPAPMVVHIVKIDLRDPDIRFLVTPGEPSEDKQLHARTTSAFLGEFRLQVAINGDFFVPWHSTTIFDYYPHVGDDVNAIGFASSQGKAYSIGKTGVPSLYISKDNHISFEKPPTEIYNAISGNVLFVQARKSTIDDMTDPYHIDRHPRTAVGLSEDSNTLILILVDGRQANYSEGATMKELSAIAIQYGAYRALNLDGGGSTTLAIEDASGSPFVLNSPIDNYIPGRERPVANHLGVFAAR